MEPLSSGDAHAEARYEPFREDGTQPPPPPPLAPPKQQQQQPPVHRQNQEFAYIPIGLDGELARNNGDRAWRPKYLHRRVYSIFFVLFLAILIATEALRAASQKHNGIAAVRPGYRYLWSYGPTAGKKAV